MLSPLDLQNKKVEPRKKKYDKAEMDEYLALVFENYTELYNKNLDLEKKVKTLSDGIQYYRSIESTMQKALVLAEKTSKETKDAALLKAEAIEKDANSKAAKIVSEAEQEYKKVKDRCLHLVQQFNQYKMQLKQVATAQLELVTSESFDVYSPELDKLQDTNKKIPMKNQNKKQAQVQQSAPEPLDLSYAAQVSEKPAANTAEDDLFPDIPNTVEAKPEPRVEAAPDTLSHGDMEKTMVIPDLKAELEEKNIKSSEADTMSILTADTIDLSKPIKEVQKKEEAPQSTIRRPLEADTDTATVQEALIVEPVDALPTEPTDVKLTDATVSEPEIEKLEPIMEPEKDTNTLDALLQSMNIGSKKKKKKGQEEDPFEFLGSVDDF